MSRPEELPYETYVELLATEPLPAALCDLDALEHNIALARSAVEAARRPLRVGSKSVRCVPLLKRILEGLGPWAGGLLCYSPREAEWLAGRGFTDLLVAYPTARREDALALARANRAGASAVAMVDAEAHLAPLADAARELGTRIPVCIDLDLALRLLGGAVVLGVRRSPLHAAEKVRALAERVARTEGLELRGAMGYEAHLAGLADRDGEGRRRWPHALLKGLSRGPVRELRARVREALAPLVKGPLLFNGGGTGSVRFSLEDPTLTEVTVGSGFLGSHLFDGMDEFSPRPAAHFALQASRSPAQGMVTCVGGGYLASGAPAWDRLPVVALPRGASLLPLEGAGEVQTPVRLPEGCSLPLGAPVIFRHAKAGELAEHFEEYLLHRGAKVAERARTYRGEGVRFL